MLSRRRVLGIPLEELFRVVAFLAVTSSANPLNAAAPRGDTTAAAATGELDWTTLKLLTESADAQVQPVIDNKESIFRGEPRGVAHAVRQLVAPYVWPNSTYYHNETLLPYIDEMLDLLVKVQHADGTYTVGNRHSPPDTGFLVDDYALTVHMLERDAATQGDNSSSNPAASSQARADVIRGMLVKAAPAMLTGGVHTPNHRWKLCGALAHIIGVTGASDNQTALEGRIEQWLAEGVDIDEDGIYSERSPIYYAAVTNPNLLAVSYELGGGGKPELVDHVRRNLELAIQHADPVFGECETVASRRQDQQSLTLGANMQDFYMQFRELALLDGNGRFAAMVRLLENLVPDRLGDALANMIVRPELAGPLPPTEQPFADFDKHYTRAGLVRARKGKLTTSVFGGSDWYHQNKGLEQSPPPFFNRFGSGLSTNPTFFRAWNGHSVLEAVRLVPNFFSMGHFRSDGVTYTSPDNGNGETSQDQYSTGEDNSSAAGVATLSSTYEVSYFLPMPAEYIQPDGVYDLSRSTPDGRFYASMDFDHRPVSLRRLQTDVIVTGPLADDNDGGTPGGGYRYELAFEVTGEEDVELTLELTLRPNGTFTFDGDFEDLNTTTSSGGSSSSDEDDTQATKSYHLISGTGHYTDPETGDTISFGPGNGQGLVIQSDNAAGEAYEWMRGKLEVVGHKVYITGVSPMRYTLQLGFS